MEEKVIIEGKTKIFDIGWLLFLFFPFISAIISLLIKSPIPFILIGIPFIVFTFIQYFRINSKITITNKRVYGKRGSIGQSYDIPLDDLQSAAPGLSQYIINLNTKTGTISILKLTNRDEVLQVLHKLSGGYDSRCYKFYHECRKQGITQLNTPEQKEKAAVIAKDYCLENVKQAFERGIERDNELNEKEKQYNSVTFYNQCVQRGVTELSTKADIAKAELVAKQMNMDTKDITQAFNDGKAIMTQAKEDNLRKELAPKEKEKYEESIKYLECTGRDKLVAKVNDDIAELKFQKGQLSGEIDTSVAFKGSREHSWAVAGGIAEGIAGPAAGVVTAMNVQKENERRREQSQQNYAFLSAAEQMREESLKRVNARLSDKNSELQKVKIALEGETSAEELFEMLEFNNSSVSISVTGAFSIDVGVNTKEQIIIYDTVKANIDGAVAVEMYQEGKNVGVAYLVFPYDGIGRRRVKLSGISLGSAKKDVEYKLVFKPYHLWEIEDLYADFN